MKQGDRFTMDSMIRTSSESTALALPAKTNRLTLLFYALIILLMPGRENYFRRLFRLKRKGEPHS